jgi:hypothetical protein
MPSFSHDACEEENEFHRAYFIIITASSHDYKEFWIDETWTALAVNACFLRNYERSSTQPNNAAMKAYHYLLCYVFF